MKILIVILILCFLGGIAWAYCQTDYNCVNDCTQKGYQFTYCQSFCSWCE